MKKILLIFCIFLMIVSCGKKYEVYTKAQKKEMYNIALKEQENGNNQKMVEIEKLMEVLEIEAKKGDETARIERTEWHWITLEYDSITDKVKDASADLLNRKW